MTDEYVAEAWADLSPKEIVEWDPTVMTDLAAIEALRSLSDAATPGPWSPLVNLASDPAHLVPQNSIGIGAGEAVPAGVVADVTRVAAIAAPANAALIVAAVNAIRAILDRSSAEPHRG